MIAPESAADPAAPDIVAVGHALVDVVAAADEEVGTRLGLHPNRAVHVDFGRLSDILAALPASEASAGGGAANVAKLAAMLGLSTVFVGRVGSAPDGTPDAFAVQFEAELRASGVRPLLSRGAEPTGACAVIRMPGDLAAVAACPSAARGLTLADLPAELIASAKLVALDGYLLPNTELVEGLLKTAETTGTIVALDVGNAALAADQVAKVAELVRRYPLILFMNEDEAEALACAMVAGNYCTGGQADATAAAEAADDQFRLFRGLTEGGSFPVIVVKRGPRGALIYANGERLEAPTRAIVPYDITGAGDAFAAGFLAAWIRGHPLRACAELGNRVAREALAVSGTRLDAGRLRRLSPKTFG